MRTPEATSPKNMITRKAKNWGGFTKVNHVDQQKPFNTVKWGVPAC